MISVGRQRIQYGFTLLEVLVAFTLLAITLTVLLRLLGNSLRNAHLAEEYSYAVVVAESALDKITAEWPPHEGRYHGHENDKYDWQADVSRITDSGDDADTSEPFALFKIKLGVSWREGQQTRHFQVSTLRTGMSGS